MGNIQGARKLTTPTGILPSSSPFQGRLQQSLDMAQKTGHKESWPCIWVNQVQIVLLASQVNLYSPLLWTSVFSAVKWVECIFPTLASF